MQAVFDTDFDIKRIIMNLNIESGVTITPENTLIVLDEIQNAPKALESLKYFCEEAPEYHVIAAGSLLGVALHEGISYPVGKVDLLDLYPFNFREFLCAMDEEGLENALETKDYNLIDNFADKYLFWLKNYYYTQNAFFCRFPPKSAQSPPFLRADFYTFLFHSRPLITYNRISAF